MSFEAHLQKFIDKINTKCKFKSRSGRFQEYSVDSKIQFYVEPISDSDNFRLQWKGNLAAQLKFDDLKAAENQALFAKYAKQMEYNVIDKVESTYDDYRRYLDHDMQLCKIKDGLFGVKTNYNSNVLTEIETDLKKLYLTHDIIMYDNMFDDLQIYKSLEHGLYISHYYNLVDKKLLYNSIKLMPYQLKVFFEEICNKVDSIANNPLYEEYKKYVIDKFANCAVKWDSEHKEYCYTLNAEQPEVYVYDFVSWKTRVYDTEQEQKRKEEVAKTYIDMIENKIKEIKPEAKKVN